MDTLCYFTRRSDSTVVGLYKQATLGDRKAKRPAKFNLEARLVWDAWAAEEGLSKEDAREQYCDLAKQLVGVLVKLWKWKILLRSEASYM